MSATVQREVVVAASPDRFFELVADFARYPEFVPGVKAARVRPGPAGGPVDVEYEIDLGVKTIRYVLRHLLDRPRGMTWSLLSSDWMKVSNGSWRLDDEGGKTRARYAVEIQIAKPPLIPQALVDRVTDELTKVQLPRMLEAFRVRAERSG
jgi:ribosome-associated toxin RatA of RatAB toxin-antitoxin module